MPLVELETVFDRLSGFPIRTFEEGKLVIAEGSSTGRLLFLIQGEVEVSKTVGTSPAWPSLARCRRHGSTPWQATLGRRRRHPAVELFHCRQSRFVPQKGALDRALHCSGPIKAAGRR